MRRFIIFILSIYILISCEDVIEVDVVSEPPRLVVDAVIRIDESAQFQTARVEVSLTDSFFGESPVTELTNIGITNIDQESTFANPNTIQLLEVEPGVYERQKNTTFFTEGRLVFQLTHEGRNYFSATQYVPTVPIDSLEQRDGSLFGGDDTEIAITFTDNPDRDDYYVFDFGFDEFLVSEDSFYQGQQFEFSYFYDDKLQPGTEVEISILGADLTFFNYMGLLFLQSGDSQGPFQTPVATVRGNIFDVTDIDNIDSFDNVDQPDSFALGYFAIVQEFKRSIVIE